MRLLLMHPEVATRDCGDCQLYAYDEKTGERIMRGGQPILRGKHGTPPCRTRRGCHKGTPEVPKSLIPRNVAAYLHFLECSATGQFPDDAIVRRNAMLCRQAEIACQRHHDTDMTLAIVKAVSHA